jgi:hypothetical protein
MKATSKSSESVRAHGLSREPLTPALTLRQLGLILLVAALWTALLVLFLNLTSGDQTGITETLPPVHTPTSAPQPATATEPAIKPAETLAVAETTAEPATSEPSPAPSDLPTALPPAPSDTPTEAPAMPTETATSAPPTGPSFAQDVQPILISRCQRCHNDRRTEDGLNLLSHAGVMAGSKDGPVVIPGSSATSRLVETIVTGEMPKQASRLPPSEIELIRNWVDAGALDN